jgi:hypothetical protein
VVAWPCDNAGDAIPRSIEIRSVATIPLANQGRSLFKDTKFGEELSDLGSIATDCLGDIRRSRRPEEADRCISDSGHYFGTRTFSDPACVLAERDVTHVVTPILD